MELLERDQRCRVAVELLEIRAAEWLLNGWKGIRDEGWMLNCWREIRDVGWLLNCWREIRDVGWP